MAKKSYIQVLKEAKKKEGEQYVGLFAEAMEGWGTYHEEYQTLIGTYKEQLKEMKQLKITQKKRIKQSLLRKFPKIEFLDLETKTNAADFLYSKTTSQVKTIIEQIEKYKIDEVRLCVQSYVQDDGYLIRQAKSGNDYRTYGVNPDCCSGSSRHSTPKIYGDFLIR